MGKSGPLPGATFGRKPGPPRKERPATPQTRRAPDRETTLVMLPSAASDVPEPPEHLEDVGRALWTEVWSAFPQGVLDEQLDRATVLRYCECTQERDRLAELVRKAGSVLLEPYRHPAGKRSGTEAGRSNPAVPALRALGKELDQLGDRLAASPASRARLGLTITRARAAQADADNLLGRMWRKEQP